MSRMLSLIAISLSLLSPQANAKRQIPPILDKWWPMCVFDGTGGASEPHIKEMVRMAAECGVMLEVFPKAFNFAAEDPDTLAKGASRTCDISAGFKDRGVNRGSVLAIVPDTGTAQAMCKAAGAGERSFCGQLGFDPGESFKFRMGNTGYYGDVAAPGASAFSVVSGKAVNARDMSAAALGQGMMALPQGFGAGNGVGGEYEGQAAGGSNVDSGWSDYGCEKMREAAFPNIYPNKMYFPLKEVFAKKNDGKLVTIDLYDPTRTMFGRGGGGPSIRISPAVPPAGLANAEPDFPFGTRNGRQPSVMDNVGGGRASQATASPTGHPGRAGASADGVVNLRQSAEQAPPVNVAISEPSTGQQQKGSQVVSDDTAQLTDEQLAAYGLTRADVEGKTGGASAAFTSTASTASATTASTGQSGSATASAVASASAGGTSVPLPSSTPVVSTASTSSNSATTSMADAANASTTTGSTAANMLMQSALSGNTSELALATPGSPAAATSDSQGGARAPASTSNFNDGVFNLEEREAVPKNEDRRGNSVRSSSAYGITGGQTRGSSSGSDAGYTRVRGN